MEEDKYMGIIIVLIFAIGIAFMIGYLIGWQKGFEVIKMLTME